VIRRTDGLGAQRTAGRPFRRDGVFSAAYRESVEDFFEYWTPSMQDEVARHCYPWRRGAIDFREYLLASEPRYTVAYETFQQTGAFSSLCDVGGFFGAFALTLARIGHGVAMTEALEYYNESFSPLFKFLTDSGVRIIDYDPFSSTPPPREEFDALTVMAVLEHYPHSLQGFMLNVLQMLKPGGRIYIEVPNIAYWPKRKAMLFGRSPLAPIADIYRSSVPFIGHHHEFTREELEEVAHLSDLEVLKVNQYNYSFRGPLVNRVASDPVLSLMSLIPSMRECVAILAKRT
jgi:2-polyprenyl-3-methyl-5-hydroxy-6-metoxy-1,4-benzoquinol methylase